MLICANQRLTNFNWREQCIIIFEFMSRAPKNIFSKININVFTFSNLTSILGIQTITQKRRTLIRKTKKIRNEKVTLITNITRWNTLGPSKWIINLINKPDKLSCVWHWPTSPLLIKGGSAIGTQRKRRGEGFFMNLYHKDFKGKWTSQVI